MRPTFDFTPLFRSTVGFDRLLNTLENANRLEAVDAWPPYDIVKAGEDTYRVTLAVAGFAPEELTLDHEPNLLVVSGQKAGEETAPYLHRGIAHRDFRRRFELADHVKVTGANLADGLLTIDLVREIPEAMKPRRIEIGRAQPQSLPTTETRQIESDQQAA
ncbi:16 kDa heat shock protein A [Rubellimicrobium mesophilum DSM 19309]|uniref:16 kDa heat shock protein A n=1 Tax=Rubellimicrobium mesophilum DSM 19309 TaxID=442562 RepID=A0A017HMH1_9RHOB|nr:Hsp20 family protein [Rubellimicrobium mesophilum]EYD74974.1 16 kDa heat shock protein A [Rubellimicrobium mesophilum DSM 19309]